MLYKFLIVTLFCLMLRQAGLGQVLQSGNFRNALEQETRTQAGIPGKNYFQNKTEYSINVKLNPKRGILEGEAEMVYHNNSPDTLRQLVFRIYQDMRKEGGIRDTEIPKSSLIKEVDLSSLIVNGTDYMAFSPRSMKREGTNLIVNLRNSIIPGDSQVIQIAWNYPLPADPLHRFGKYGSENHFIAYWYPQIAVYDDLNGWDLADYTDTQEFYNDFNYYDIKITVPRHYMVWATGRWMNAEEVLSEETYRRYTKAMESDNRVSIVGPHDRQAHSWMRKRGKHTFHFQADSITDFAFGVSDSYVFDGTSVLLDSVRGERVTVFAAYKQGAANFDQVVEAGRKALLHFANYSYGVVYPFPSVTVFNGEGGMEFPMIVNNGTRNTYDGTAYVAMHELAHAYFPFLVGINERKNSWIDEGLTTYLPITAEEFMNINYYPITRLVRYYELFAGTERDVPLYVSAIQTRGEAYQYYTYMRSSMAFYMLEELMGSENFRAAIRDFIQNWQYKHPSPYDLFNTFKNHSNEDIDWLINQWFYQPGYPDMSLSHVVMEGDSLHFQVNKPGNFAVPAQVTVNFKNDSFEEINILITYWKNQNIYHVKLKIAQENKPKSILLNYKTIPDKNRKDNYYIFPD